MRKSVESSIEERFKDRGIGEIVSVPEIDVRELDVQQMAGLQKIVPNLRTPLVIKGLAEGIPAFSKWTPQYFADHYGDEVVNVRTDAGKIMPSSEQQSASIPLRELALKALSGNSEYYGGNLSDVFNNNPELRSDLNLQHVSEQLMARDPETFYTTQLFLGGGTTKTGFHCALSQNLFFNVYGQKTWTFVSPKDTIAMYPAIRSNALYFHSLVDSMHTNEQNTENGFPLFPYIDRYRVTLGPGDLLVSPEYWWHEVQNHGATIGVANRFNGFFKGVSLPHAWFINLPRAWNSNRLFFTLAMLSRSSRSVASDIVKTGWGSDKSIAAAIRK